MLNYNEIENRQWVCIQCGYNMIGEMPDVCPFCGVSHEHFRTWDEAEKIYRVACRDVNGYVSRLLSEPKLGLEHAAYRVETGSAAVWIDSPSAFNRELAPVKCILFTHHHFLGASNRYRRLWNAEVRVHELDAKHPLSKRFDFDRRFSGDFEAYGIQAYHIGGHTPGFTIYIHREVLFICDYVFMSEDGMIFNPYGPERQTRQQAAHIQNIIENKTLSLVCGYNYIAEYGEWSERFKQLTSRQ